jgi:hypothetical protein
MDIVKFPVLQSGSSVGEALKVMREAKISGVVVPHDNHVSLINYGELIVRGIPKQARLGKLDAVRTAPIISFAYAKRLKLPMKAILEMRAPPRITELQRRNIEYFLQEFGYSFAVMGPVGARAISATVLTLSELGKQYYSVAPQDCYCTNLIRPHPYGLDHPDVCTYDGTKIDCD